ncbi:unnamed protein product, partial [Prorocentrum cordatum]
ERLAAAEAELAELRPALAECRRQVEDLCAAEMQHADERRVAAQAGSALEAERLERQRDAEALRRQQGEAAREKAEWQGGGQLVAEVQAATGRADSLQGELQTAQAEVSRLLGSAQDVVRRYEDESARRLELEERVLTLEEKLKNRGQKARGDVETARQREQRALQAKQQAEDLYRHRDDGDREAHRRAEDAEQRALAAAGGERRRRARGPGMQGAQGNASAASRAIQSAVQGIANRSSRSSLATHVKNAATQAGDKISQAVTKAQEGGYFEPICTERHVSVRYYSWDAFQLVGDFTHLLALLLCLAVILRESGTEGVSFKTHLLFLLAYTTRFSNILFCEQSIFIILYKVLLWTATLKIVVLMWVLGSRDDTKDTLPLAVILIPTCVMTVVLGVYSVDDRGLLVEILWIFSTNLEAVTMLPQYIYCYRDEDNTSPVVTAYVLAMGGYRMIFGLSWAYHYLVMPYYLDMSSFFSGILGIVFFCDYLLFKVARRSTLSHVCIQVDDTIREAEEAAVNIVQFGDVVPSLGHDSLAPPPEKFGRGSGTSEIELCSDVAGLGPQGIGVEYHRPGLPRRCAQEAGIPFERATSAEADLARLRAELSVHEREQQRSRAAAAGAHAAPPQPSRLPAPRADLSEASTSTIEITQGWVGFQAQQAHQPLPARAAGGRRGCPAPRSAFMAAAAAAAAPPLGLCGPSELRVPRLRQCDSGLSCKEAFRVAATGAPEAPLRDRVDAQRRRTVRAVLARCGLVRECGGRRDVAALVAEFLGGGSGALRGCDLLLLGGGRGGAAAHASSRGRNVDFLFKAVPKTGPSRAATAKLEGLLEDAWQEDPEVCLRLVFHLGAARKGKQDRWSFYDAMLWLWAKSPATVLQNLQHVEPAIYWKALLEILARICEGGQLALERDVVMYQAYAHQRPRLLAQDAAAPPVNEDAPGWRYTYSQGEDDGRLGLRVACGDWVQLPPETSEGWTAQAVGNGQNSGNRKVGNCGWQPRTRLEQAENAVRRFDGDPLYRALHLRVAALFADRLAADERSVQAGKRASLVGKWAPLLDKSFDRRTLVAESIARMLYPPHLPEFAELTEQHYSYRARLKYAALLNELREHRREPARLMNAGRWSEIRYKSVPGTCMKVCAPLFMKHDAERFQAYLEFQLEKRKGRKIHAGAAQPHELMRTALVGREIQAGVAELQWRSLVADVRKGAQLRSCVAVCDMSESMMAVAAMDLPSCAKAGAERLWWDDVTPARGALRCLDVAMALSLVLSEVSAEPFCHKVLTFEDSVTMVNLGADTSSVARRAQVLRRRHQEALDSQRRHPSDYVTVRGCRGASGVLNGPYSFIGKVNRHPVYARGSASIRFDAAGSKWVLALRRPPSSASAPLQPFTCPVASGSRGDVLPRGGQWVQEDTGATCQVFEGRKPMALSAHLYDVFKALLELPEPPEKVFVFSAMAFSAAAERGSGPGTLRGADGAKLTVFQAAEELFRKAGKAMPEVIFWNLGGCGQGVPVVATQPGAVLVSGFSAALVKDILASGAVDPLALVAQVASEPLFAPLALPAHAERAVRECLALEGRSARDPEAPRVEHAFAEGEEWEMVQLAPEVEAAAVEAAAPRRPPLRSVRGVRRVREAGDVDAAEDALLALIGKGGSRAKEARSVLSVAVAGRLGMRARVWLDVEHAEGGRLGVLAVTVSARAPEAQLRQELAALLLPAVDALLRRVVRRPEEAARRREAFESGEWFQRRPRRHHPPGPRVQNADGELPYREQLELFDPKRRQSSAAEGPAEGPFLPEEEVVPAMLAGLEGAARAAVVEAASDRRSWPAFHGPRISYTPLPRDVAAEKAARAAAAAAVWRRVAKIRGVQWAQVQQRRPATSQWTVAVLEEEARTWGNLGTGQGAPADGAREAGPQLLELPPAARGRGGGSRSTSPRLDPAKRALRQGAKQRQLSRQRDRDAKAEP